jgi:ABC-type branched-subunit amino acid transport system substrate-binding protein
VGDTATSPAIALAAAQKMVQQDQVNLEKDTESRWRPP